VVTVHRRPCNVTGNTCNITILYQQYSVPIVKNSEKQSNSKNDHWCTNRHMSTQSPPNTESQIRRICAIKIQPDGFFYIANRYRQNFLPVWIIIEKMSAPSPHLVSFPTGSRKMADFAKALLKCSQNSIILVVTVKFPICRKRNVASIRLV